MKRFLCIPLMLAAMSLAAQTPWSYTSQGTILWPGANAKDLIVGADDITYVFGDIGLIDIEEGALTLAAVNVDGSVAWENTYDKPGTMEVAMRASQTTGGNFLLSGITIPGYRPYFLCTNAGGTELWNSDAWTDPMPENSASQTYAYELPSGNIACIVADDILQRVTRYELDPTDGSVIGTISHDYFDIIPYDIGTIVTATTVDIIHNQDDHCMVIADFTATGADTTDYIFRFNEAFEPWGAFGISNDAPGYWANSVIQISTGEYVITGTKNAGAFFDLYEPMITVVQEDLWWSYNESYPPTLANATGGAITETADGDLKWIRYQMSGTFFDPAVGDYVEIASLDFATGVYATKTIDYAPYNTFECIAALNGVPAIDDAYVVGGTAWEIGVPSYNLVIGTGAADAMPECIFNCVWPGDADNSGEVDMDDLLAIGLGFGTTGPARDAVDISWTAHAADEWATALPTGENHKYTDANGDGVINADDELAVDANYGNLHELITLRIDGGDAPIYFAPTGPFALGENTVPIMLGTDMLSITDIYGIRFTALVEGEAVDSSSVNVVFEDSWMGSVTSMLQLSKNTNATASADAGSVRTDQNNASGYGQIGTLNFVVIDNIAGKKTAEELTLNFANVRAIDVNNTEIPLTPEAFTGDVALNTEEPIAPALIVFPNPVSGNVLYTSENRHNASVQLYDIDGRSITLQNIQENRISLPVLPTGEYLLRITTDTQSQVIPVSIQR